MDIYKRMEYEQKTLVEMTAGSGRSSGSAIAPASIAQALCELLYSAPSQTGRDSHKYLESLRPYLQGWIRSSFPDQQTFPDKVESSADDAVVNSWFSLFRLVRV